MEIIIGILVVLVVILCILMVASILLQEDKTGGGIGIVGGSSQSFFGANSASFLSRTTSIFVIIFFLLVVVCAILASSFSKNKFISTEDIYYTESAEYTATMLRTLPVSITADDFDSTILSKIDNDSDKVLLTKYYEKSSDGKSYTLKDKISRDDKNSLLSILNSIGYSQEAKRVIIKDVDNVEESSTIEE
jgi:preprotein translocase subunit SecG